MPGVQMPTVITVATKSVRQLKVFQVFKVLLVKSVHLDEKVAQDHKVRWAQVDPMEARERKE